MAVFVVLEEINMKRLIIIVLISVMIVTVTINFATIANAETMIQTMAEINSDNASCLKEIDSTKPVSLVFCQRAVDKNRDRYYDISVKERMEIGEYTPIYTQIITIDKEAESRMIQFDCALPNDYRIVRDYDYNEKEYDKYDCGDLLVLNKDNEVIEVVSFDKAMDASNNIIDINVSVKKDSIIYEVNNTQHLDYPIVITATSHPNYYRYCYYTKTQVLYIRNRYSNSTLEYFISAILGIAGCHWSSVSPWGAAWSLICLNGGLYYTNKFNTWDKIYVNFAKNYAKIGFQFRWHSGHRCYYANGRLTCEYTYSKN